MKAVLDAWIEGKHGLPMQSSEDIKSYQLAKQQELFSYVKENSTYYQKHFADYDIPKSRADFQKLPCMAARDLQDYGMQLLCVPQGDIERVVTLSTSGTSGMPKRLYFTKEDQELTIDFFHHGMKMLTKAGQTLLVLLPFRQAGSVGDLLLRGLRRLGVNAVGYGLVESLRDFMEKLKETMADSFVGTPMNALALAHYVRENHITLALKTILLSTDYLADSVKKTIEESLHCEVFNHYGITEAGLGAALDCTHHTGMHIRENDLLFEVLHPSTGKALADGETGEIVLTTLTRRGMPLVRYRTGDYGILKHTPCRCQSNMKRLIRVNGRIGDEIGSGETHLSFSMLDELLFSIELLMDYRAVYEEGAKSLKIHAVFYCRCTRTVSEIRQMLTNLIIKGKVTSWVEKIDVTAEAADDITPQYKGKRCLMISRNLE